MRIDFHAHILPGADHGSASVKESLTQLLLLGQAGIDAVVATPHFYPHHTTLQTFLERRDRAATALAKVLPADAPTVYLGAEVTLCEGLHRMQGLEKLAIQGTDCILIEMPMHEWNHSLLETLEAIRYECGLHPVLAHLNRYIPEQVKTMTAYGYDVQLNADGIAAFAHKPTRLCLREATVVALGTDLHETDERLVRNFTKAEQKLGARAQEIFSRSAALLASATPLAPIR